MKTMNKFKAFIIFTLISVFSMGSASAFPPPPGPRDANIYVENNTGHNQLTDVLDMVQESVMTLDPNPISPGESHFQNEISGYTTGLPGFTLAIGDNNHPNGRCIVSIYENQGKLIQPGDGSDGFVCQMSGTTVTLSSK